MHQNSFTVNKKPKIYGHSEPKTPLNLNKITISAIKNEGHGKFEV